MAAFVTVSSFPADDDYEDDYSDSSVRTLGPGDLGADLWRPPRYRYPRRRRRPTPTPAPKPKLEPTQGIILAPGLVELLTQPGPATGAEAEIAPTPQGRFVVVGQSSWSVGMLGRPMFELRSSKPMYEVGELIIVDITLHNPRGVLADEIAAWIKYDPTYLEAVDMQPQQVGVNINPTRGIEPLPLINSIDVKRGEAIYQVVASSGNARYFHGTLGSLGFKGIKPTEPFTRITFQFGAWGAMPDTHLIYHDRDVLASENDHRDGTIVTSVVIK